MAQPDKAKLLSLSLEVDLNKQAAVSLFDRFGKDNFLFRRQFEDTQRGNRALQTLQRRSALRTTLTSVKDRLDSKREDLKVLQAFDRKQLDLVADLTDRVGDLQEDLLTELEVLDQGDPCDDGGLPAPSPEDGQAEDTILAWRVAGLPRAPQGLPR